MQEETGNAQTFLQERHIAMMLWCQIVQQPRKVLGNINHETKLHSCSSFMKHNFEHVRH